MKPTETQLQEALFRAQHSDDLGAAENYLKAQGVLTFGIEHVDCADRDIAYVNLGDTYDTTIVQEGEDFAISSWGAWYEETENQHCEDDGVVRCGYCSEFTPVDSEDWHKTVCEHCGRYVDSGEKPAPTDDDGEDDAPNLDCMTATDLHAYCQEQSNPAPLREYAAIKARAIDARLAGRIPQALQWEKALDALYQQLPSSLRW